MMMQVFKTLFNAIKQTFTSVKQFEDQIETVAKAMNFKRVVVEGFVLPYEFHEMEIKFKRVIYIPEKQLREGRGETVCEIATNFIAIKYGIEKERINVQTWMVL